MLTSTPPPNPTEPSTEFILNRYSSKMRDSEFLFMKGDDDNMLHPTGESQSFLSKTKANPPPEGGSKLFTFR